MTPLNIVMITQNHRGRGYNWIVSGQINLNRNPLNDGYFMLMGKRPFKHQNKPNRPIFFSNSVLSKVNVKNDIFGYIFDI